MLIQLQKSPAAELNEAIPGKRGESTPCQIKSKNTGTQQKYKQNWNIELDFLALQASNFRIPNM